jgi:hypothetical protein
LRVLQRLKKKSVREGGGKGGEGVRPAFLPRAACQVVPCPGHDVLGEHCRAKYDCEREREAYTDGDTVLTLRESMCPFLGRGKTGGVEEFAMACMMRHGHGVAWEVPEGRQN